MCGKKLLRKYSSFGETILAKSLEIGGDQLQATVKHFPILIRHTGASQLNGQGRTLLHILCSMLSFVGEQQLSTI
jgi:hypothetical protein